MEGGGRGGLEGGGEGRGGEGGRGGGGGRGGEVNTQGRPVFNSKTLSECTDTKLMLSNNGRGLPIWLLWVNVYFVAGTGIDTEHIHHLNTCTHTNNYFST